MSKNKSNIVAPDVSRAKKELENLKAVMKQIADVDKEVNDFIIEDDKRVTSELYTEQKKQLDNWKIFMQQGNDEIKSQAFYAQDAQTYSQAGGDDAIESPGYPGSSYNTNLGSIGSGYATPQTGSDLNGISELYTMQEASGQIALPDSSESQKKIADQVKSDYDEDMKNMQAMAGFSRDINSNLSKGGNDFLHFIQEALQEIMKIYSATGQEGGPGFGDIMGIIGSALPFIGMGLTMPNPGSPSHNIFHTPNINYGGSNSIGLNASVNLPLRALTIGINNENNILSRGSQ